MRLNNNQESHLFDSSINHCYVPTIKQSLLSCLIQLSYQTEAGTPLHLKLIITFLFKEAPCTGVG